MLAHGEASAPDRDAVDAAPRLTADDWRREVRAALKKLHDITWLEKSTLAARYGRVDAVVENRGETLQRALLEEIEKLKGTSRDDSLYRAVHLGFVNPAPSQHLAADAMRVAYGTYRRHLEAGIERVIATLRAREAPAPGPGIAGPPPGSSGR